MKENIWKCSGELLGHFARPFKIQRERIQYQKRLLFYWEHCCQSLNHVQLFVTHELQHARLPYPLASPGVCSNSCPLSWWCHPTISSSIIPFSSCIQCFPASRSFPRNQHFASGGQSIGASALASVLQMNIQDWFPLGWTGWISLLSKGLSRVISPAPQFESINPLALSLFYGPTLTSIHDYWKNYSFD